MNITIREAISQLKVPNHAVNADSRLTNKYFYSILSKHRDWLIKETQSRFKLFRLNYLFQPYRCVELIPAPKTDPCCGIKSRCQIYRTKHKLPKLVLASDGPIIRRVTSIDGATELFEITPMEWNRKTESSSFEYDKTLYYFWDDGYLYFPNLSWKMVYVEAFFSDKITNNCDGEEEDCVRYLDTEFRIPQDLLARCIDQCNIELANYYHRLRPDENQIDKNNERRN